MIPAAIPAFRLRSLTGVLTSLLQPMDAADNRDCRQEREPNHVPMSGSRRSSADAVDDRVAGDETARTESEKHGPWIAKDAYTTRQGQAQNAKANEQDRELARLAQPLIQEPDRNHSHDQRCDAPRERIDETQIASLVSAIEEQHVPVLRIGLATRCGRLSAAGTSTNGSRHNERTSCVEDITLMSASRSPSILTNAFHVACTSAAPRTITNTSADHRESRLRGFYCFFGRCGTAGA